MSAPRVVLAVLATTLSFAHVVTAQMYDPPARVGRLSNISGSVSLLLAGDNDWTNASLNYPLTSGDALWSDIDARAELHIGASSVHLAPGTSLVLDAVEDNFVQLRAGQGTILVRLWSLDRNDGYEIDTPGGTVVLRTEGRYRIDVTPDGRRTTVTVREGDAEILIDNTSYPVRQGSSVTLAGTDPRPRLNDRPFPRDAWEAWADDRDRREDGSISSRYVPREMVGYEDLDSYGDWQVDASYGPIWYPRSMAANWAPYRNGRWESRQPWGWTWIDDSPWGFAPFHYGRWSHDRGRWGWIPGNMRSRPVYAPALVAFISGDNWGVSLSFGSRGGVGWIPLGPQEMYVPSYRSSPTYIRNVNIMNVTINNIDVNRTDVQNVRYRNRDVQGAITAVPRDDFTGSRPVGRGAIRVQPGDLGSTRYSAAPVASGAPIAPPSRGSTNDRGGQGKAGNVRRPPVDLPRTPDRQNNGRGRDIRNVPPGQQGTNQIPPTRDPQRGRGGGQQPPVTPPPVIPAQPPTRDPQRGRGGGQQPPVTPPPAVPTQPPTRDPQRGRGGGQQPPVTPPPTTTPPVIPPPAPDRGRGRSRQTPPPPPVIPPTTPPARGGGSGGGAPPSSVPVTPPSQGRGAPTKPTTPPGRGGKPTRTKPDSGRGGGGFVVQFEQGR